MCPASQSSTILGLQIINLDKKEASTYSIDKANEPDDFLCHCGLYSSPELILKRRCLC